MHVIVTDLRGRIQLQFTDSGAEARVRTTAQVMQGFRAGLGIHAVCVLPTTLQSPSRDPCKRVWDVRVTLFIPEGQGVCVGGSLHVRMLSW